MEKLDKREVRIREMNKKKVGKGKKGNTLFNGIHVSLVWYSRLIIILTHLE